jgi:hypothetical protein
MKFVEAILSNNSTDDHCKEFVKQRGLVPLMQILSLPNLPVDFAASAACQSVAQVCKAILHLAREPQVVDQALSSLADALVKCEKLFDSYLEPSADGQHVDGSVLIRELAQTDNPLEACNVPAQTPLLHAISSVHSIVYLLITLGKISHNEVRTLTTSKWGSAFGEHLLSKALSKLYATLIWESSMLLWLCNEEQQQLQLQQQLIQLQHIQRQTTTTDSAAVTAAHQLAQLIQHLHGLSSVNFDVSLRRRRVTRAFLTAFSLLSSTRTTLRRFVNRFSRTRPRQLQSLATAQQLRQRPPPRRLPPNQVSTLKASLQLLIDAGI